MIRIKHIQVTPKRASSGNFTDFTSANKYVHTYKHESLPTRLKLVWENGDKHICYMYPHQRSIRQAVMNDWTQRQLMFAAPLQLEDIPEPLPDRTGQVVIIVADCAYKGDVGTIRGTCDDGDMYDVQVRKHVVDLPHEIIQLGTVPCTPSELFFVNDFVVKE